MLHRIISAAMILIGCVSAPAASIVISNASFDFPTLAPGESTYAAGPLQFTPEQSLAIPGWGGTLGYAPGGAILVGAGIRNATNAVDGNQTLYIRAHAETPGQLCTIWQDVGEIWPETTYTMKVAVGGSLNGIADGATGGMALMNGAEGTLLGATNFTSIGILQGLSDYVISSKTGPSATGRLVIALSMQAPGGPYPYEVNFDHVRIEATLDTNAQPALTIAALSGGLAVAWPPWATNYWLDASHDLSLNPPWFPLTNTGIVGTNRLLLPPPLTGPAFYRLRQW